MNILLITATDLESKPVLLAMNSSKKTDKDVYCCNYNGKTIDLLISGIGSSFSIYSLMKRINEQSYDLIINFGIAGSFVSDIEIGDVVMVSEDCFADLGIDDNGKLISLFESGYIKDEKMFLRNGFIQSNCNIDIGIKKVRGISVNRTSGNTVLINEMINKYEPAVETMEGAGIAYVCKKEGIDHVQIRGISNMVEPRNPENWNAKLAMDNTKTQLLKILNSL